MKNYKVNMLVKISVLAAISVVLMMFQISLPIFPSFLEIDLSDLPALFGGFALGPIAGIIICFLKNLLNVVLTGTITGGIGELSNFVIGASMVSVSAITYNRIRSKKGAIIGLALGVVAMTIVGAFSNYFVMLPLYAKIMMPLEEIIKMGTVINPAITDLKTFVLWSVVPFNLLKGGMVSIVTAMFYKKISPILKIEKIKKAA